MQCEPSTDLEFSTAPTTFIHFGDTRKIFLWRIWQQKKKSNHKIWISWDRNLHSRQHIKLSKIFSSDDFLYHWFCQYSDQPSSCTSALVSVRYSNSHFISIKKKKKRKKKTRIPWHTPGAFKTLQIIFRISDYSSKHESLHKPHHQFSTVFASASQQYQRSTERKPTFM